MRYEVRKWKNGWGIWRVWRFFAWRCRDVGPFGWDMPWTVESLAHEKCASLYASLSGSDAAGGRSAAGDSCVQLAKEDGNA